MADSFFDDLPDLPALDDEREDEVEWTPPAWMEPPQDELPGILGSPRVIARTDGIAVVVSPIEVFSTGVLIPLTFMLRRRGQARSDWEQLSSEVFQHGTPRTANSILRLGIALPDGRKITSLDGVGMHQHYESEPDGPTLHYRERGGSGGPSRLTTEASAWLWPLPASGDLEFVLTWPAVGLTETRISLDGAEIAAAARRARPLWDDPTPEAEPTLP